MFTQKHKDGVNDYYYGCDSAGYKYSGRGVDAVARELVMYC